MPTRLLLTMLALVALSAPTHRVFAADATHPAEFDQWAIETEKVVRHGAELFEDPFYSENGKTCAGCHPGAERTRADTYPKYRDKQGRVIQLWEMVNWCLNKGLGKDTLAADDPDMTALVAYLRNAARD